ncbi:hypothetical protein OM076_13635 [Solirubrobacter ginsenosidimutans]|uniref:Peptidase metallopeptidase domain-containing protein n=1 Tax=Solirubrobacter ginsenosidimutans TaxID=490573 RepID=A0A9X3MRK4_9ACTN|nr:hypothetical protein [Solirubrobacter ginsenosidimutans]MDA0161314.1 hypothetical protein [Solirubrobacter ginsenosidimutans]
MSDDTPRVCIDRDLPSAYGAEEMAIEIAKKWETGKTLRVTFLSGMPAVQEKVVAYARQWEEYANIRLEFGSSTEAEIRVAFLGDGSSWSAVGTDALNQDFFPRGGPTMNFGWLTSDSTDDEYSRVVLHEFGHALGCIHEHQSPDGGIPWNREAVYRYYGARGWSKRVVDQQVLRRYDRSTTQFTDFDPTSIMEYPVPKELTDGAFEIGWNMRLSESDKAFIAELYPRAATGT